ncbi:MAG: hypothetical protein RIE77_09205 [Phycisphaerales bacterium]|jgi:hypothetical protein
MTPFEPIGPILDLIGKLSASPIRVTKNARIVAEYLAVSFATGVADACRLGIAKPLTELRDCKLKKMQAIDLAQAAEAHNAARLKAAEAERTYAEARKLDAESREIDAKIRAIDGELEVKRLDFEGEAAEKKRLAAERKLELAVAKLRARGGELYLEPPADPGGQPETDAGSPD